MNNINSLRVLLNHLVYLSSIIVDIKCGVAGDNPEYPKYCIPQALVEAFRYLVLRFVLHASIWESTQVRELLSNAEKTNERESARASLALLEYAHRARKRCEAAFIEGKLQL